MDISSVGVVGAGQMGNGIAHVFALAEFDVVLNDIDRGAIERALKLVETNLARQVNSGRITKKDAEAALKRISTTMTLADLGATDLIIEAATERESVKVA
ncbi:MAG: 3-hydroxybutyryl-CoA dehydrogenase, partial [Boseongicola sp. SB0675_bin_26]|nr:3-hydroxybutyryl-CoA dehydrogenase [Boseongicola sp. SB0675_bin_26]